VSLRVCAEPECPALTDGTRCDEHRKARDKARGTRQKRGYDAAYDRLRRQYQHRMDSGETFTCWRCVELGKPHTVNPDDWHLGHDNDDKSVIRGPQCPASNLATSISRDA
jgi:hypothetical protein